MYTHAWHTKKHPYILDFITDGLWFLAFVIILFWGFSKLIYIYIEFFVPCCRSCLFCRFGFGQHSSSPSSSYDLIQFISAHVSTNNYSTTAIFCRNAALNTGHAVWNERNNRWYKWRDSLFWIIWPHSLWHNSCNWPTMNQCITKTRRHWREKK